MNISKVGISALGVSLAFGHLGVSASHSVARRAGSQQASRAAVLSATTVTGKCHRIEQRHEEHLARDDLRQRQAYDNTQNQADREQHPSFAQHKTPRIAGLSTGHHADAVVSDGVQAFVVQPISNLQSHISEMPPVPCLVGLPFDRSVTLSHPSMALTFIETATFTRLITDLVDDGTYSDFQKHLADHPAKGDLLSGCGGVRKIRMALPGRGKSGGARICYLYLKQNDIIYLLYVFTKGDADNLSADGKKAMRSLAQQIKAEYS